MRRVAKLKTVPLKGQMNFLAGSSNPVGLTGLRSYVYRQCCRDTTLLSGGLRLKAMAREEGTATPFLFYNSLCISLGYCIFISSVPFLNVGKAEIESKYKTNLKYF